MRLYKLTDANNQTWGGAQWGKDVSMTITSKSADLYTGDVIHCFRTPLIASFMTPMYTDRLRGGNLWESEGEIIADNGLIAGCKTLTTLRRIEIPQMTPTHRAAAAILCAKTLPQPTKWRIWADDWLSGGDRSTETATVAKGAMGPTMMVTTGAELSAVIAASAAASAAAGAELSGAVAAVDAVRAAMAVMAAGVGKPFDLSKVLEQAMKY